MMSRSPTSSSTSARLVQEQQPLQPPCTFSKVQRNLIARAFLLEQQPLAILTTWCLRTPPRPLPLKSTFEQRMRLLQTSSHQPLLLESLQKTAEVTAKPRAVQQPAIRSVYEALVLKSRWFRQASLPRSDSRLLNRS